MALAQDTARMELATRVMVQEYDHDPLDEGGHGARCVPGCAAVAARSVWFVGKERVTDPERVSELERALSEGGE